MLAKLKGEMMKKNLISIFIVPFLGLNLYALNLDEAIEIALKNNNSLKKQNYILEEAQENVVYSKSTYLPTLNLSYEYNANKENLGEGKDNSKAAAIVSYNLFNGLKDFYGINSAKFLEKNSLFTYEASKNDLIYSTKIYYISYLKSLKNIETKQNAYKLLQQQYEDSKNRYDQGLLAKNDLLQVNAQMLQSKQALASAEASSRIAKYELKNILGGKLSIDEKVDDLAKKEILSNKYDLSFLDNRSEIKALKNSIESIVSQKKANNGNYMPNVNLNLSYIKLGEDSSLNVNEPAIDEQQTATVTLNWNLYNAGRDYSQDIIFQKRILQYKEELEALKLSVQLQYEKAIEEFDVSKLNYETAKVSLAQSEENYKIVYNRFKEGLSTTTDLINANYLLTSAKQSFDSAYYDRFLAKAALDRVFEK